MRTLLHYLLGAVLVTTYFTIIFPVLLCLLIFKGLFRFFSNAARVLRGSV